MATATARPNWRPTPFIGLCMALHVAGVAAVAVEPSSWLWTLTGFAGIHAVIAGLVLLPRNKLLGANITRLPLAAVRRGEIALTFDDGPDPAVTPRVLDLLDTVGARATFFCVAEKARRYPDLVREIHRRNHQVENHSDAHSLGFAFFGYWRMARDIDAAQASLTRLTGHAPRFFRAPAGMRNPLLDPILQMRGLRHVAWTRRGFDTAEADPEAVLSRLAASLDSGNILLLHDGGSAPMDDETPVVLAVLPALLARTKERGLRSVTLDGAFAEGDSHQK
ncbi:MAG: polysaccharide deacetylase family protein [Proteobacteria bacterium]|nr:polysaccharide deacetylase family protein [Pseudomonadota bacterium]